MVPFMELLRSVEDDNVQPVPNYGLEYSQCESELGILEALLDSIKQREVKDGCLNDRVGLTEMLLEEDERLPVEERKYRLASNRLARMKGQVFNG